MAAVGSLALRAAIHCWWPDEGWQCTVACGAAAAGHSPTAAVGRGYRHPTAAFPGDSEVDSDEAFESYGSRWVALATVPVRDWAVPGTVNFKLNGATVRVLSLRAASPARVQLLWAGSVGEFGI